MSEVRFPGEVNQTRGTLKLQEQIPGRQRNVGITDRIAARVQNRAAEHIRVGERQAQRYARSAGEPRQIDALRVHRITHDDVVLGEQGQRFAPTENGFLIAGANRSEEHTSELQSRLHLVCRLLLEKKKTL